MKHIENETIIERLRKFLDSENSNLTALEDIAKGIISPCLPLLTNQNGDDIGNPIRYGDAESKYMW